MTITNTVEDPFQRRRGKPVVADPDTGELVTYERISTLAGLLDPPYLQHFHLRYGMRAALLHPGEAAHALIGAAEGDETAPSIADLAAAAGMNDKRERGKARHAAVQWVLAGNDIPAGMDRAAAKELQAVCDTVLGLGTLTGLEVPVINDESRCAGSADYVGVDGAGRPFVADLKTGRRYGGTLRVWAAQIALYARSVLYRDHRRGEPVAAQAPRLYIVHAPQDDPTTIDVLEFDPAAATKCAEAAHAIHTARQAARTIDPLLGTPS